MYRGGDTQGETLRATIQYHMNSTQCVADALHWHALRRFFVLWQE
jgi:hypothetical protein